MNTIAVINYKLVLGKEYDLLPTVIENQKQFIDSKISSISLIIFKKKGNHKAVSNVVNEYTVDIIGL
ncbi:hypothetical protein RCA_02600 [Rickettsia canadensis str. CA410]|uniref:Uncharacterized protein n=1 Tax=Rickettsia canadensis str. CA410 TaxID=1105107 RepID=A0ABM5MRH0_RICCA|nr:hypothetical protein RCA_02600 [Rickettsia canadensis str. CA410]